MYGERGSVRRDLVLYNKLLEVVVGSLDDSKRTFIGLNYTYWVQQTFCSRVDLTTELDDSMAVVTKSRIKNEAAGTGGTTCT